jgi:L-seryl-tRNA(Ser) seleniumtransferase
MEESNRSFIEIEELLQKSGAAIAKLLDVEAARVTPGVSASLALSAAACMTRGDGPAIERLPDTTGLPGEALIQHGHRYKYDRCLRLSGIRLAVVGQDGPVTAETVQNAITRNTAMAVFPAHLDGKAGTLRLEDFSAVARSKGLPVIVDAAYKVDPPEGMRTWFARGGDLVCISSKYLGGPNSGGFVFGRRQLIDWIARCDFTGFESSDYLTFGRPFKLDRQIIVGVSEAVREWMNLDHAARFRTYEEQVGKLSRLFAGRNDIGLVPRCFTMEETLEDAPVNALEIVLAKEHDARDIAKRLKERPPRVLLHVYGNSLVVAMEVLAQGEEVTVGKRILEEMASSGAAAQGERGREAAS